MLSEYRHINKFTPIFHLSSLPVLPEANPDKLTLALEPESAALYIQENVVEDFKGALSYAAVSPPSDYMVIDIGGGTVDITVHVEVDGAIQVYNIPTGNECGGTKVNDVFSQLLQKFICDPKYEKFLRSGLRSKQILVVNGLLYDEFETQKRIFGRGLIDEIAVSLPNRFVKYYDKVMSTEAKKSKGIEYEDDTIYISESVVESQLFGPVLDEIIKCTLEAIEENGSKVNTFYLVGGFGGCKYVHEKVTAAIGKVKGSRNVIVPVDPHLAVCKGAVMWRKNPEKIKARQSDATYGIEITLPFDPQIHDEHYRYYDIDYGQYRCDNVFAVFLEKGELASASEVHTMTIRPKNTFLKKIFINVCATPNLGVCYTMDKHEKSTVTKIGQLLIDVHNPNDEHKVDVTMDFSGTEIHVKVKYRPTGKEVKTVCDLLSAQ